jgi:hypothetical protein
VFHHRTAVWAVTAPHLNVPIFCVCAAQAKTILRRWRLTLHHLQLLSAAAPAGHAAPSRSFSHCTGAGAQAVPFRGGRVGDHAFYDFNVWTEHKRIEKLRYMHRNPVKRGLVVSPELWRWSSFRAYFLREAGPVKVNDWEMLKMKIRPPAA